MVLLYACFYTFLHVEMNHLNKPSKLSVFRDSGKSEVHRETSAEDSCSKNSLRQTIPAPANICSVVLLDVRGVEEECRVAIPQAGFPSFRIDNSDHRFLW